MRKKRLCFLICSCLAALVCFVSKPATHQIQADEPDEEANSAAETSRIQGSVRWTDDRPISDCQIDLRDSAGTQSLTVSMQKQSIDWPLSAMSEAFNLWERGDAGSRPDRKQTPKNQAGVTVPNLDGSLWLNTDKHSLDAFRGQYVLLDFYTTWCGPCDQDFPKVRMV